MRKASGSAAPGALRRQGLGCGAHQLGRRAVGRHAFAHKSAAQRPEGREKIQREGAGEIDRQSVDQQRAVENVDAAIAQADVAGALAFVTLAARARCRRARRDSTPSRQSTRLAMSRRLRLRPCAPIGGKRCADSPISAMRSAGHPRGFQRAHRQGAERAVHRDLCQAGHATRPRFRRQALPAQGLQAQGLARRDQPDEAGAIGRALAPAQRHEGEGARALVEFGRNLVMRLFVRQQHGQRHLRIGPGVDGDARDLPRLRIAALARDDELSPRSSRRRRAAPRAPEKFRSKWSIRSSMRRDVGIFARRLRQFGDQRIILDILAEGVEVDFARAEFLRRSREDRAGVVDHADAFHRGGMFGAGAATSPSAR